MMKFIILICYKKKKSFKLQRQLPDNSFDVCVRILCVSARNQSCFPPAYGCYQAVVRLKMPKRQCVSKLPVKHLALPPFSLSPCPTTNPFISFSLSCFKPLLFSRLFRCVWQRIPFYFLSFFLFDFAKRLRN